MLKHNLKTACNNLFQAVFFYKKELVCLTVIKDGFLQNKEPIGRVLYYIPINLAGNSK